MKEEAVAVYGSVISELTEGELRLIKEFHEWKRFEPEIIDT